MITNYETKLVDSEKKRECKDCKYVSICDMVKEYHDVGCEHWKGRKLK